MNPEQWLSLKWNGGSTMSDRWLNQSKIIHPYIGYAKSAEIAKKSLKTGISVKELVLEEGLLKEEELKEILKPEKMTQPMREKVMKAVS